MVQWWGSDRFRRSTSSGLSSGGPLEGGSGSAGGGRGSTSSADPKQYGRGNGRRSASVADASK